MPHMRQTDMLDALMGLGRGTNVDAYVSSLGPTGEESGRVLQVPLTNLAPAPWQPRVFESREALRDLMASIRRDGVLHPITVRPRAGGDPHEYEIVAGHRRLEALRQLAEERNQTMDAVTAPVIVRDLTDVQARVLTAQENHARADLSKWEEARSIESVREALESAGQPSDVRSVAEAYGCGEGTASEYLRIAAVVTVELLETAGATDHEGRLDGSLVWRLNKDQLMSVANSEGDARLSMLREVIESVRSQKGRRTRSPKRPRSKAETVESQPSRRAARFTVDGLRDRGGFKVNLTKPFSRYTPDEARGYLEDVAPAVAALGEAIAEDLPYVLTQAAGGAVIYVRPEFMSRGDTEACSILLSLLHELRGQSRDGQAGTATVGQQAAGTREVA